MKPARPETDTASTSDSPDATNALETEPMPPRSSAKRVASFSAVW